METLARKFNDLMHSMPIYKSVIQVYSDDEARELRAALATYDIAAQIGLPEFPNDELDLNVRVYLDTDDCIAAYLSHHAGEQTSTSISLVYVRDNEAVELLCDAALPSVRLILHNNA